MVYGSAEITDNAVISGFSRIHGYAKVQGNAKVMDDVELFGNTTVKGDITLSRWIHVFSDPQYPLVLDGKANISEQNAGSFLYKQDVADKVLEKIHSKLKKKENSVSKNNNDLSNSL